MNPLPTASSLDQFTDPWLDTTAELERCARFLDLEDWIVMRMRQCEQETTASSVFMTDAGPRPITASFVCHSSTLGAPLVGVRIGGETDVVTDRIRAMRHTWMAALFGVPHGGACMSLALDTESNSENAIRAAIDRVGVLLVDPIGDSVLFPDGIHFAEMEWLRAAVRHANRAQRALDQPSIANNEEAAAIAMGYLQLIHCSAGHLGGLRVAVQGFDVEARELISRLSLSGARVVAIADESGGVYDGMGLDPAAIEAHHREQGMLLGFPAAEARLNHEVLETECDVLVLAGPPSQVGTNAEAIRANNILEATPEAISAAGRNVLSERGKRIIPHLLCGGLRPFFYSTAAQCTAVGASQGAWMRRAVRSRCAEVRSVAAAWNVPLHRAAELLAIRRVADVMRVQGA